MAGNIDISVRRRQVFYIPGFDPYPPRRYRELYRCEGARQAGISGYGLRQTPAQGSRPFGWQVEAVIQGQTVRTRFEVLIWSDIVRQRMRMSIPATYMLLLRTICVYFGSGAIFRLVRMRKGPVIASFYPAVLLILQLAVAVAAFRAAAYAVGQFAPVAAGWLVGGVALVGLMRLFRRWDQHLYAHYLMLDYAFSAHDRGAYPETLRNRLQRFRGRIAGALHSDVDEVLVVGHSSGAHLAVSVLASLLRKRVSGGASAPALSFLSLGQAMPMVSFLPDAGELRRDLHQMAAQDRITWVDVSAPGDGCCFALCDPVAVTGVAPKQKRWPLVLSAAFSQTLSPERRQALRWRFFRRHFQYLCAFDQPGDYDYFQITAGPMTLAERFAGRAPSANRIETPLSRFRDMAP